MEQAITDDLQVLCSVLSPHIQQALSHIEDSANLLEIVLDLGRLPEARYVDSEKLLSTNEITEVDIDFVVARIGAFSDDNRAGIPRTLHRISAIRNRKGRIVGLTCRVGRAVYGTMEIIRDIVESGKSILLLGRPGVGKCVTGDSLILTEHGLLPLADLVPANLATDQFAPIQTRAFGMHGLERASHAYNGGLAQTMKVTTRQGFALEGTPEHPVLALTETGELVFRRLDEFKLGDYVAIQRGQQCFGAETRLPTFEFIPRTNALDGQVPAELNQDLARFLGHLVAEGDLTFDNQVTFSNTDPEMQNDMAQLTQSLFGLQLRRHLHRGEWNNKDFRIFGVKLRRFLAHLGLTLGRAADKRIPTCILSAPKPIVTAFLRAYFDGDGSVYGPDPRVEVASASHALISQLHILLLNFGIVGNLRKKYNSQYDRDYFCLTLLGENVARFAREIGFLSTTKQGKLNQLLADKGQTIRNPNLDVIPFQNERLRELRAQIGASSPTFYRFTKSDNRAPSYHTLGRILAEAETAHEHPAYSALADLQAMNFFFDSIKQIETSEAYVYDLTIPSSHSFFANGFVSHNTTMLREAARVLSEAKRVVIVDTSNEIGGDGDIPHPAIGKARRMQVPKPALQHEVMIEAVENHMPEVIVIDEIGRELEAEAARTIAERGVQLIGTAHGQTLDNLLMNPTLMDLVGGIQSVTLSDEEARRRGTQKSILERKAPPTFDVLVEIQDRHRVAIHHDVGQAVDAFLRGRALPPEIRTRDQAGQVRIDRPETLVRIAPRPSERGAIRTRAPAAVEEPRSKFKPLRLYPYGLSQDRLETAGKSLQLPIRIVNDVSDADAVLTLKNYYRKRPPPVSDAERRGVPVYVLRSNTIAQMEGILEDLFGIDGAQDPVQDAMDETEAAIQRVLSGAHSVELAPQNAFIRRHQHERIRQANLFSRSLGKEPKRRVRIYASEVA